MNKTMMKENAREERDRHVVDRLDTVKILSDQLLTANF